MTLANFLLRKKVLRKGRHLYSRIKTLKLRDDSDIDKRKKMMMWKEATAAMTALVYFYA
jgi:hypothetical protein